jgi:protein gp37
MFRDQIRYGKDPRKIVRAADPTFHAPLKWTIPARVFTCSWSDFFIEDADEWRPAAWDIMRKTPWLTYQVLTKRIENVPSRLPDDWPLSNVWLGVTTENQQAADMRIPELLTIQAAKRFICAEPLLTPIYFRDHLSWNDWVIVGGESGSKARRPAKPWIVNVVDQCDRWETPVWFKQWGGTRKINGVWGGNELDGKQYMEMPEWGGR